jgi:hypothetical protein
MPSAAVCKIHTFAIIASGGVCSRGGGSGELRLAARQEKTKAEAAAGSTSAAGSLGAGQAYYATRRLGGGFAGGGRAVAEALNEREGGIRAT